MDDSIVIVGTGAMACLFASRLSAAGVGVTMLGTWLEGLEALRRDGVKVVDGRGGEKAFAVNVASSPADCQDCRLALVLVKSWQTERAARQLSDCLADDGIALTLQNGLGNREVLAAALGAERAALGVTTSGATLVGPGQVCPGGEGGISLGKHERIGTISALLNQAGFEVDVVDDADDLLWSKLVINAAINPLGALLRCSNGELIRRPSARELMAKIVGEAVSVAAAEGRRLTYLDPVAAVELVAERTSSNRCSMLQDVERGAPTEIDAISGAIVSAGEEHGIRTPINQALWLLVRAQREGCN